MMKVRRAGVGQAAQGPNVDGRARRGMAGEPGAACCGGTRTGCGPRATRRFRHLPAAGRDRSARRDGTSLAGHGLDARADWPLPRFHPRRSPLPAIPPGRVPRPTSWRSLRQIAERLAWGETWINSGRIFTREDGGELHPADVTKHFNELVAACGSRPGSLGRQRKDRRDGAPHGSSGQ